MKSGPGTPQVGQVGIVRFVLRGRDGELIGYIVERPSDTGSDWLADFTPDELTHL